MVKSLKTKSTAVQDILCLVPAGMAGLDPGQGRLASFHPWRVLHARILRRPCEKVSAVGFRFGVGIPAWRNPLGAHLQTGLARCSVTPSILEEFVNALV